MSALVLTLKLPFESVPNPGFVIPATCTVWAGLDDEFRVTVSPVQVCVFVQLVVAAGTNGADAPDGGPVPFTFVALTVHEYV